VITIGLLEPVAVTTVNGAAWSTAVTVYDVIVAPFPEGAVKLTDD
jgi:hypothetical protein